MLAGQISARKKSSRRVKEIRGTLLTVEHSCAPALLQRHGEQEVVDPIHVQSGGLLNHAACVRRDGLHKRRWASAYRVSNASEYYPEPNISVNTTIASWERRGDVPKVMRFRTPYAHTVTDILMLGGGDVSCCFF